MISQAAQVWRALGVDQSPLLADLRGRPNSWWRFILGAVAGPIGGFVATIAVVVIIAVPAIIILVAYGMDASAIPAELAKIQQPDFKPSYSVALALIWTLALTNGPLMLTAVWVASVLNHRPLKLSFTTARRWRWRQLFGGMALYGLALGVMQGVEVLVFGQKAQWPLFTLTQSPLMMVLFVAAAGVGLILAAGAEELVFRGWLLRHSAVLTRRTWIYIPLNGLLFSLVHWDFDPNAFIARAVMGAGFSYMALRMGGIEFSTGAHAANNILIVLFIEPLTLATPAPMPLDAGSLLETAVMLVMIVGVTELAIRVPVLARMIGPPSDGAQSVGQTFA